METKPVKLVKCPQCGKSVSWVAEERFKPFCSERCKLIDLGCWAYGEHVIPGESVGPEILTDQRQTTSDNHYN